MADSRRAPATRGLAAGATAAGLLIGFAVKQQCVVHPWVENYQYTHLCYNEIQALFGVRGIGPGLIPYVDTRFEYPALTGMFMYVAGFLLRLLVRIGAAPANSDGGYFYVTAALFVPMVFATTFMLRPRVTRDRLLLWAIGAPTVLYTFHNWDLIAVTLAVWGLVAYEQARDGESGAALSAGASAKLFPAFFIAPAVLGRWAAGERAAARRLVWSFLAVYALLNVPWIVASGGPPRLDAALFPGVDMRAAGVNGWMEVWTFHAGRYPDYWTVWYWIAKYGRIVHPAAWWEIGSAGYRDFVNLVSLMLFGGGCLWLLIRNWKRRPDAESYPVVASCLGIVCLFLLTNKVYSPQYALWVAPLLAMLAVPWRIVFAYLAAEVAVLVSGFMWFTVFDRPNPGWEGVLEAAVWFRALTIAALLFASLHVPRLLPVAPEAGTDATEKDLFAS